MKAFSGVAIALLVGCHAGPEPISVGVDSCARCGMLISDVRFAAEYLEGSRVAKFDSLDELRDTAPKGATLYASDFATGGLVALSGMTLVVDPKLPIPMGGTTVAFATRQEAEGFAERHAADGCRVVPAAEWLQGR
jgi:hypothetical protein